MPRPEEIVLAYEGSPESRDALVLAELLARTCGSNLVVVRVDREAAGNDQGAAATLGLEVEGRIPGSLVHVSVEVVVDRSPPHALREALAAHPRSLVVLGSTHRTGLGRVVPGGVFERLLHDSPTPIAVAPRGYAEQGSPRGRLAENLRVVAAAFDGSEESQAALALAAALAGEAEATLRVIAVGPHSHPGPATEELTQAATSPGAVLQASLHEAVERVPDELRTLPIYEQGEPVAHLLARLDEGVDLLVMGSRGQGRIESALLGTTSSMVIGASPCPVIVIPRPALTAQILRSTPDEERR